MAFTTKQNLTDAKFYQQSGGTMTLSGDTVVTPSGDLSYESHPTFTEDTQIIDKKYVDDNIVSGVTSGSTYDLLSPSAVQVGGIPVDYVLTGKTSNCIIQDMLYPELCGTLTNASVSSVVLNPATSPLEIGCVIPSLSVTANFSRGSINPQYESASPFRSGLANTYCFSGAQVAGSYACTTNSVLKTATSYTILDGANTWGACVASDIGVQPISNKDNNFSTPLAACTSPAVTRSITGILPYFWGVSDGCPTLNSALLATGLKDVALSDASNSVQIDFGTNSGKFLWFATPQTSTTKQGWYEGATNKGNIGQVAEDVWDAPVEVSVNSPSSCWTGETYKMYTMNVPTSTTGTIFCMTNNTQQ